MPNAVEHKIFLCLYKFMVDYHKILYTPHILYAVHTVCPSVSERTVCNWKGWRRGQDGWPEHGFCVKVVDWSRCLLVLSKGN